MAQYVYTMQGVTRWFRRSGPFCKTNLSSTGRQDWRLGPKRFGKSSLLRIMAGQDTEIDGEARAQRHPRWLPTTGAGAG